MAFQPDYDVPEGRLPYTLYPEQPLADGRRVGVLALHGFMGSPISSRPMADYLAQRGLFVHCPLLPGHGQYPDKLASAGRKEWIAEAEEAFRFARQNCDELFIMAHSMGNVLGAHLILRHGNVRGMIMLAPVIDVPDRRLNYAGIARYFMPYYYPHKSKRESMQKLVRERVLDFDPTIDFADPDFQARLPEVTRVPLAAMHEMVKTVRYGRSLWPRLNVPVHIFVGDHDVAAPPENSRAIFRLLPGDDKELTIIPNAGHELMRPFDPAHTQVWSHTAQFLRLRSQIGLPLSLAQA